MPNYRIPATKWFNTVTGKNFKAWAPAAAAYFSLQSGKTKKNFVEAMNDYYGGLAKGTIILPPTVTNGASVAVVNSASAAIATGTATVSGSTLTNIKLPSTTAGVNSTVAVTCTVTGTYVSKFTPTVVNGVITAIVLS